MVDAPKGRRTQEVVDGSGLYFSRLAVAGPYAFLSSTAVDPTGRIAGDAQIAPPYSISPAAHIAAQTRYIFERYRELLSSVGTELNNMLQVEQWTPHKVYADRYLNVSRGRGFMDRGRPASAFVCTGDMLPEGVVITPMGIAVLPRKDLAKEILTVTPGYHDNLTRPVFGEAFQEEGPFNEVVAAGPFVFIVGDVIWPAGVTDEGVRVPDFNWWGSAIRNEAEFLLTRLERYLGRAGCSLSDVVHSTVYLNDIEDLFELDEVWRKRFRSEPPARAVVPVRGLGVPRREAPKLRHSDGAVQMEHLTVAVRPGMGAKREVISIDGEPLLHQSEAIRAGNLLWISGQMAGGASGLFAGPDVNSQAEYLMNRLQAICEAGHTSIQNLVRLRGFVIDPEDAYAIYSALKHAVPTSPPTVAITGVPSPLPIPGCRVMLDGVAYVPER
jgi:2-iminobutanoate/2-iminopropanoate deaminase